MRTLWPKYKYWSKLGTEHQVYRYTPKVYRYTLAKNDQNTLCTGTCSRCTGTCYRKVPRMCVFVTFFHILIPKSTLYFKHTSKPFHIHLIISIFTQFFFQLHIFLENYFMNSSKIILIWVMTHTQTKHDV